MSANAAAAPATPGPATSKAAAADDRRIRSGWLTIASK